MTIIRCMAPEIWNVTEFFVILDHFLPFYHPKTPKKSKFWKNLKKPWRYYHFTQVYQKWWSYAILFLRYDMWHVIIFHFGPFFALFPPNNLKNENFKKMNKTTGDNIILHKCTKNHDQMVYCSWDMAHDGWNCYFSIWAFFCSFIP